MSLLSRTLTETKRGFFSQTLRWGIKCNKCRGKKRKANGIKRQSLRLSQQCKEDEDLNIAGLQRKAPPFEFEATPHHTFDSLPFSSPRIELGLSVLVTTFLYISHLSLCGTNERETLCHERRQRTSLSLSLLSQICVPHRTYTRMLAVPLPRVKSLPFSRAPPRHDPIIHDSLDRMGQRDAVWMTGSRVSIIAKTNDVALSES